MGFSCQKSPCVELFQIEAVEIFQKTYKVHTQVTPYYCDITIPISPSDTFCFYIITLTHLQACNKETSSLPRDTVQPCSRKSKFFLVYKSHILTISTSFIYMRKLQFLLFILFPSLFLFFLHKFSQFLRCFNYRTHFIYYISYVSKPL